MVSRKVLQWLIWFKELESEKQDEAIRDDNKELAEDIRKVVHEVSRFIEKEERKRAQKNGLTHEGHVHGGCFQCTMDR